MLAETIFATCALGLSSFGFNGPTRYHAARMLVVNGNPERVNVLRHSGVQAYGAYTDDGWSGITLYHAVCEAQSLPFLFGTFHMVAWFKRNPVHLPAYGLLLVVVPIIREGGYLAFNKEVYECWVPLMQTWKWKRHREPYEDLSVYQRPFREKA